MGKHFDKQHKYTFHKYSPWESLCSGGKEKQVNQWHRNNLIFARKDMNEVFISVSISSLNFSRSPANISGLILTMS